MFVRVVKGSAKKYVLIVRSFRDKEGKPRQETVLNLGPVTDSNQNEVVNLAKRMISNLEGSQTILDDAQDIKEERRYNWGAVAVIQNLWKRLELDKIIKHEKYQDAIKLMLIDRFCRPASKLATYNNKMKYQDFEQVDLQHMYRSLDYLADNMELFKNHICHKQAARGVHDIVFFDVTTLYFESQKADLLREFGYSKDCKFNEVQIVLCLVVDSAGKPLTYEIFPGNTSEGQTILPILERLKTKLQFNRLVIVADRGIGSKENLQKITDAGYDYIIGAKLRSASSSIQKQAIDRNGFIDLPCHAENDARSYKFITNNDQSWVVLHSSKRARKDRVDRERLLAKAKEMLESKVSLKNNRGAKKFIKMPNLETNNETAIPTLDLAKIENEALFDGYYAISFSDNKLSASEISSAYHGLWQIEESFRTLKSFFEVRPMFHWSKKRIEGHIMLNFLLLVMEQFLLTLVKEEKRKRNCSETENISHERLRNDIDDMQLSILQIGTAKFASYSNLNQSQESILSAINVTIPTNKKLS